MDKHFQSATSQDIYGDSENGRDRLNNSEYPVRTLWPRKLSFYNKDNAKWSLTEGDTGDIEYLAVSYRQKDYADKRPELETSVQHICDHLKLDAYWLDFVCTGTTQEEKNKDLYRIADVFRRAKATVIMIPDFSKKESLWKSWGNRVWTFPEALLSKNLYCKEGAARLRRITLPAVAHLAYNMNRAEEQILIDIYDSWGKDFVLNGKERTLHLCVAIWSRETGTTELASTDNFNGSEPKALPGERVYALMSLLQHRITPNPTHSEKHAFDELMRGCGLEIAYESVLEAVKSIKYNPQKICAGLKRDSIPLGLYEVTAAKYNDKDCLVKSCCELGTRVKTLGRIKKWLVPPNQRVFRSASNAFTGEHCVFWMYGLMGSGKSTIARTIAQWCDDEDILGASFFCSNRTKDCHNASYILQSIAAQLRSRNEKYETKLAEALRQNKVIIRADLRSQLKKLIVDPSRAAENYRHHVVIIDGLDECLNLEQRAVVELLEGLNDYVAFLKPLKFFVTSRPEHNIQQAFGSGRLKEFTEAYNLDGEEEAQIGDDLLRYFKKEFGRIPFPVFNGFSEDDLKNLVDVSCRSFMAASTATQFIKEKPEGFANLKGFVELLQRKPVKENSPIFTIYKFYERIIEINRQRTPGRYSSRGAASQLEIALGIIVSVYEPLSVQMLCCLLKEICAGCPSTTLGIRQLLHDFHSLISIPDDDHGSITLIHPSFEDFLKEHLKGDILNVKSQNVAICQLCIKRLLAFSSDAENKAHSGNPDGLSFLYSRLQQFSDKDPVFKFSFLNWVWYIKDIRIGDMRRMDLDALIKFLSDLHSIRLFSENVDMKSGDVLTRWAIEIIESLPSSSDFTHWYDITTEILNSLKLALYRFAIFLVGRYYLHLSLADLLSSERSQAMLNAKRLICDNYPSRESRRYTCRATDEIMIEDVYFDILLISFSYQIDAFPGKLVKDSQEIYRLTKDRDHTGDMKLILKAFVFELKFHHEIVGGITFQCQCNELEDPASSQLLLEQSIRESPPPENVCTMPDKATPALIVKKYKDLLCYIFENESHHYRNVNFLYRVALEFFYRHWIKDEGEIERQHISRCLPSATLLVLFLNPNEVVLNDLHALLSFISPATLHSPLKDKKWEQYLQIKEKKSGHSIEECTFLDYSSIVEEIQREKWKDDEDIHEFVLLRSTFLSNLVEKCTTEITKFTTELNGNIYKDRASGSFCADILSCSDADNLPSKVVYALQYWYRHVRGYPIEEAIKQSNILSVIEKLLSGIHSYRTLYHCTNERARSEVSALCIDLLNEVLKRNDKLSNLQKKLYDVAIYFILYAWASGEDELVEIFVKRTEKIRHESELSHCIGLHRLDMHFPKLQIALVRFGECYAPVMETNQKLASSIRKLRELSLRVDKVLRRMQQFSERESSLQIKMTDLYAILEANNQFFRDPSQHERNQNGDNSHLLRNLESSVNRCIRSLEEFHDFVTNKPEVRCTSRSSHLQPIKGHNLYTHDAEREARIIEEPGTKEKIEMHDNQSTGIPSNKRARDKDDNSEQLERGTKKRRSFCQIL